MSTPDPLDAFGNLLLDAGRREQPRADVRERVLAAAVAHGEAGASALAPRPEHFQPVAPRATRRWRYGLAGTLGLAAAALLVAVVVVRRQAEPVIAISAERSLAGTAAIPSARYLQVEAPPAPATAPTADPSPRRMSSHDAGHRARDPREAMKPVAALPPASLADEIAALDRARTALSGSDPAAALRVLDEYEGVLHGTRLTAEATLLRIDALARSGRAGAASDLASRFVEDSPGSALADRARAFVHVGSDRAGVAGTARVDSGGLP